MCYFLSFACEVKFCGVLLFVICKLQRAMGEEGLWIAALIFATFFPAFSPDFKLVSSCVCRIVVCK